MLDVLRCCRSICAHFPLSSLARTIAKMLQRVWGEEGGEGSVLSLGENVSDVWFVSLKNNKEGWKTWNEGRELGRDLKMPKLRTVMY